MWGDKHGEFHFAGSSGISLQKLYMQFVFEPNFYDFEYWKSELGLEWLLQHFHHCDWYNSLLTLFLLKILMPCEKCLWYKIDIMIFSKDWRSPAPLKSKIHCFLVGGTRGYRFYFLLNLQLKWNVLQLMSTWKSKLLMARAHLTEVVFSMSHLLSI
jgi:hypothetical protein